MDFSFYSASWLKQQSTGRHFFSLRHINLILSQPVFVLTSSCCVLSGKPTNLNFIVSAHVLTLNLTFNATNLKRIFILTSLLCDDHFVFIKHSRHSLMPNKHASVQLQIGWLESRMIKQECQSVFWFYEFLLQLEDNIRFYFLNVFFQLHQLFSVSRCRQSFLCNFLIFFLQSVKYTNLFLIINDMDVNEHGRQSNITQIKVLL